MFQGKRWVYCRVCVCVCWCGLLPAVCLVYSNQFCLIIFLDQQQNWHWHKKQNILVRESGRKFCNENFSYRHFSNGYWFGFYFGSGFDSKEPKPEKHRKQNLWKLNHEVYFILFFFFLTLSLFFYSTIHLLQPFQFLIHLFLFLNFINIIYRICSTNFLVQQINYFQLFFCSIHFTFVCLFYFTTMVNLNKFKSIKTN